MERFVRTVRTNWHTIQVGNQVLDKRYLPSYVVLKVSDGPTLGFSVPQALDLASALLEAVKHVEE